MPLTRVEGDFSQVSNVVQVTTSNPPGDDRYLAVAFQDGEFFLYPDTLDNPVVTGDIFLSEFGYVMGITVGGTDPTALAIGANTMFVTELETSVSAATATGDFGDNWSESFGEIFANSPVRSSRVAYNPLNDVYLYAGSRNSGATSAGIQNGFSSGALSWTSVTAGLVAAIGNLGIAGVGFCFADFEETTGYFYAYSNDGKIARSEDGETWDLVFTGGPSVAYNVITAAPLAKFTTNKSGLVICLIGTQVVASISGGATWTNRPTAAGSASFIYGGTGFNDPYVLGIAFCSSNVIYGWTADPFGSPIAQLWYEPITEGDLTGSQQQCIMPEGPEYIFDVVTLQNDGDAQRVAALGFRFDTTYGSFFYILESVDAGVTWDITSTVEDFSGVVNVGYLALAEPVGFTPPVSPNFVALSTFSAEAIGGAGSGNQEPHVFITFGAGVLVPLGQMYVGGGAANGIYDPAFLIDGGVVGVVDPDPLGLSRASYQPAGQWWFGVDPPDPSLYEILVHPQLGSTAPVGSPIDTWINMATEPSWNYQGVFGPPANAVLEIHIRDANTLVELAGGEIFVTQTV